MNRFIGGEMTGKRLKLAVPLVVLVIVLTTLAAYAGVQQTDAFRIARAGVMTSDDAKKFGEPLSATLRFFGYSIRVSDSSGDARFTLNVSGSLDEGVAHVLMEKRLGQWSIVEIRVLTE
jgi:hypothetical protein